MESFRLSSNNLRLIEGLEAPLLMKKKKNKPETTTVGVNFTNISLAAMILRQKNYKLKLLAKN